MSGVGTERAPNHRVESNAPIVSSVSVNGPTATGGTVLAIVRPAGVRLPRNATVTCRRSFAIGRPPERRTASFVARATSLRVASSGQSAKNMRRVSRGTVSGAASGPTAGGGSGAALIAPARSR